MIRERLFVSSIPSPPPPRRILEIGTYRGLSTAVLASALQHSGAPDKKLVSVDVFDVNRECSAGESVSPAQAPAARMQRMGCADFVEFVQADSLDYLSRCADKFDLIFLDGDHRAPKVYREIPAALRRLNPNGQILLHDYYPHHRPLAGVTTEFFPGPGLAVEKLQREGADLSVLPLGKLPWTLDAPPSTLALLLRA